MEDRIGRWSLYGPFCSVYASGSSLSAGQRLMICRIVRLRCDRAAIEEKRQRTAIGLLNVGVLPALPCFAFLLCGSVRRPTGPSVAVALETRSLVRRYTVRHNTHGKRVCCCLPRSKLLAYLSTKYLSAPVDQMGDGRGRAYQNRRHVSICSTPTSRRVFECILLLA